MKSGLMKKKDQEEAGEIDLTPMLDVVFILLIFSSLLLYSSLRLGLK